MKSSKDYVGIASSWQLFNRIAHRYDLLNRLLSLGIDRYWRWRLAKSIQRQPRMDLLDVGTGSGDLLQACCKQLYPEQVASFVGLDMSEGLLAVARKKLAGLSESYAIQLQTGDGAKLAFPDACKDVVVSAFAIRNIQPFDAALAEAYRVLKPGGQLLILEFGLPRFFLIRWIYLAYFRFVLPKLGAVLSGDPEAYRYLNESVEAFPYGDRFCQYCRDVGFRHVGFKSLTFGIVYLYQVKK